MAHQTVSKPIENIGLTPEKVQKLHESLPKNFDTAYLKCNLDYKDNKQSIGLLTADIRIKKDEKILVSTKLLGITIAKALITPTQVSYYEKGNNTYFIGNYSSLSNFLGTDLNFQKVQNLLLGQAVSNFNNSNYQIESNQNIIQIKTKEVIDVQENFVFDSTNFTLKSQEIDQKSKNRSVSINYLAYNTFPETVLPKELIIFAKQENKQSEIKIAYKNITFNENLTFPFEVPEGYKQIIMN